VVRTTARRAIAYLRRAGQARTAADARVARHLDRTVHATEALLVRARAAFRRIYEGEEGSR